MLISVPLNIRAVRSNRFRVKTYPLHNEINVFILGEIVIKMLVTESNLLNFPVSTAALQNLALH